MPNNAQCHRSAQQSDDVESIVNKPLRLHRLSRRIYITEGAQDCGRCLAPSKEVRSNSPKGSSLSNSVTDLTESSLAQIQPYSFRPRLRAHSPPPV